MDIIDDMVFDTLREENMGKKEAEKKDTIHRVASLVKELVGERSIRSTAADAGVAASYITGILKEKYLPSADILRKLTSSEAKPQNAITLEDLMVAAGYQKDYVEEAYKDMLYEVIVDEKTGKTMGMQPREETGKRLQAYTEKLLGVTSPQEYRRERTKEVARFESLATGIIYKALADSGIHFSPAGELPGVRGFRPDMVVNVPRQPILEWWFGFKSISEILDSRNMVYFTRQMLGRLMFIEPKRERKISLVISDEGFFERMCGYKDKLAYRGDLSVILINEENLSVVKEEYLSHYRENDNSSEFYIA